MTTPQSSPIKNVFLLMLENHSFDHIFGFSDITGVHGLGPGDTNTYKGKVYPAAQPAVDPMFTDPNHEFLDTMEQLCGRAYGPKGENPFQNNPKATYPPIDNSGFVRNYATIADEHTGLPKHHKGDVMRACSPNQVPVMIQLAQEFAICDNWFSSLPGPTWPNRLFSMAASSSGLDDSPSNSQILDWFKFWDKGIEFQNGSIFHLLKKHGFKVNFYSDWDNIYAPDPAPDYGGGWMPISAALHGNSIWDFTDIQHLAHDLEKPYPYQFTLIEPNYGDAAGNTYKGGSSQHPEDSLWAGEALVAATYNAIRKSRLWDTSLLIITYDEHGGYYDHAPPCSATPPGDTPPHDLNIRGFNFTQFGVRVPAVVVSPLIPKPHSRLHAVRSHIDSQNGRAVVRRAEPNPTRPGSERRNPSALGSTAHRLPGNCVGWSPAAGRGVGPAAAGGSLGGSNPASGTGHIDRPFFPGDENRSRAIRRDGGVEGRDTGTRPKNQDARPAPAIRR
jgi:phospholipase C